MVTYAVLRVGETRSRKVSNSTSSISLDPSAAGLFRELVGCLWLANQRRPDIGRAVRAVATYTNSPRKAHRKTAVGIFDLYRDFMTNT